VFSRERKLELLAGITWDYDIDPEPLLAVLEGRQERAGGLHKAAIYRRLLRALPWQNIVGLVGAEQAIALLTTENIAHLWPRELKEHYERLRKILRGESVSPSEWDSPDARARLRQRTFSHRWYRAR
jgi:hypothetical protein